MAANGVNVAFPVFAVAVREVGPVQWVLVGGGGGSSKTGIANALNLYEVNSSTRKTRKLFSHSMGSQAVQCLALHPNDNAVACGLDEDCSIFDFTETELKLKEKVRANFDEREGYLKSLTFASTGSLVATAGTDGCVRLLQFPSLELVHTFEQPKIETEASDVSTKPKPRPEMNDVSINHSVTLIAGVTSERIFIWKPQTKGDLVHTINVASTQTPSLFRTCRFMPGPNDSSSLLAIFNAKDRKRSSLGLWSGSDFKLEQSATVYSKPISTIHINNKLGLLSFGCADGAVGAVKLNKLKTKFVRRNVHSIAVTSTHLSKLAEDVIIWSGSPDNHLQLTVVAFKGAFLSNLNLLVGLLAIVIGLVLAIWFQSFQ